MLPVPSSFAQVSAIGLEKTFSMELEPEMRTKAVLPSPRETARAHELTEDDIDRGDNEDGLQSRSQWIPVGSIGDLDEFGETVAFLSSPHSAHLNGVALPVNRGAGAANRYRTDASENCHSHGLGGDHCCLRRRFRL